MNRLFTQITQRTAMVLVALTAALSGNAVNVTYSLTTHIDGRTMTKTTSQDEGATLSLPYDMRRGYTTYTFYSDAALTTQIEVVPSEDATVYVDYEFNSPFTLSIDENHGVPLVIRGNNREGFVRLNASGELVKSADGVTNLEILGDAYCLYIYSPNERAYITWQSGSAKRTTSETKPAVGWQLLKNYNYSEHTTSFKDVHFALGTYDENSNNAKYLVKGDMDNITSSSDYQNNLSVTLNSSNFTQQTSLTISDATRKAKSTTYWSTRSNALNDGKTTLVSYIFSHTDHTYTITYYIVQDYEPYGITRLVYAPLTTAVIPSNPPEGAVKDALDNLKNNDLFDYSFYKDRELTQEYGENEYTEPGEGQAANKNIMVFVKEKRKEGSEMAFIKDRWITICLPYGVDNTDSYFGEGAVLINKFSGIEVKGSKYKLIFNNVKTMEANTPYMLKAVNVEEGQYLTLYNTATPPRDEDQSEESMHISIDYEDANSTVSMCGTYDGTTLKYDADKYQFFLGYTKSNDPENQKYAEDWAEEQPKFYTVSTTRDVDIQKFRCWFEIVDKESGSSAGAKTLSFSFFDDTTGIEHIIEPDGTDHPAAPIYNISGQMVRPACSTFEGLPKGIYIVNGKKFVVK